MTGLKYHRLLQARSFEELSALTGIAKNAIEKLEDQIILEMPCHIYMRLSTALGITVDMLTATYSEGGNSSLLFDIIAQNAENDSVTWRACYDRDSGTLCRIYLAKITGSHPNYHFNRNFQHPMFTYNQNKAICRADKLEEGVYEVCARWFKYGSNFMIRRDARWFAFFDGIAYDLDKEDILSIVSGHKDTNAA